MKTLYCFLAIAIAMLAVGRWDYEDRLLIERERESLSNELYAAYREGLTDGAKSATIKCGAKEYLTYGIAK